MHLLAPAVMATVACCFSDKSLQDARVDPRLRHAPAGDSEAGGAVSQTRPRHAERPAARGRDGLQICQLQWVWHWQCVFTAS